MSDKERRAFCIDQRQAVADMQPGLRDLYPHIEDALTGQYHSTPVASGHYDNV